MKNLITAILALSFLGCSEEPEPPKRKKAPEPPPPVAKAPEKKMEAPPPPPPTPEPARPAAPEVPKILLDPSNSEWTKAAPAEFKARFSTSKGDFTILVMREWSPNGADRFYNLVRNGYYDDVRFFRVISGFMVQFGINGAPAVNAAWRNNSIPDDPVTQSNTEGMVTFAKRPGKNTRTTQVFINFGNNSRLDGDGFTPFGKVVEGMDVVKKLSAEYGAGAPRGRGPDQNRLQAEGNEYLNRDFKEMDYVKTARIAP